VKIREAIKGFLSAPILSTREDPFQSRFNELSTIISLIALIFSKPQCFHTEKRQDIFFTDPLQSQAQHAV